MKSCDLQAPRMSASVAPHWGAWIEIRRCRLRMGVLPGRTPLGCVD